MTFFSLGSGNMNRLDAGWRTPQFLHLTVLVDDSESTAFCLVVSAGVVSLQYILDERWTGCTTALWLEDLAAVTGCSKELSSWWAGRDDSREGGRGTLPEGLALDDGLLLSCFLGGEGGGGSVWVPVVFLEADWYLSLSLSRSRSLLSLESRLGVWVPAFCCFTGERLIPFIDLDERDERGELQAESLLSGNRDNPITLFDLGLSVSIWLNPMTDFGEVLGERLHSAGVWAEKWFFLVL